MLELKNIKKVYKTANEKVEALKGVSIKFRKSEFVSILGQSGCGKTTLLNIIGGLDRYTSGDLIINGKSTKNFKDRDWDAYRNYKVGFVFQNYNLIGHQTILSNVELALTLGGVSKRERKERAIKALEEVGLKDHIHKKPNQLSGGQMQRVAIARALVNNPDIILADEPTGALDTKTSVQVMEILKKISKNKLIIMVTHNPELAEQYSSRIIRILDGVITEDSNPILSGEKIKADKDDSKIGRTKMKLWTAFRLSLNNLLTKKGRTILVSFAGSIGIIGIALIQSVSNGFQSYVDKIQEDTLTSYPLTIMKETTDVTSVLLSMTSKEETEQENGKIQEKQYISKMLESLSTNDLKSFKKYLETNYKTVEKDISSLQYSYSVDPMIYSIDATNTLAKLNPSNLFSSSTGMSSGMMSSMTSTYSQMIDDKENLNNSYDVLAGKWPEKYNEMVIVLSEKNTIPDLLVYSLGLRNTKELKDIVTKIMSGETVDVNNAPMDFTYQDLLNTDLRLIMPTDIYKYNEQYNIYEDMTENEEYMKNVYENAVKLKITGIVCPKEGVNTFALNPGVAYKSELVDYIIEQAKNTDLVKKQQENEEIDILSGSRFDAPKNDVGMDFKDLISIDTEAIQSAFNIKIDQNDLQNRTAGYMEQIVNSVTTDITPAKETFTKHLNTLSNGLLNSITGKVEEENIDKTVTNYLNTKEAKDIMKSLSEQYVIPSDTFESTYKGLLNGLMQVYVSIQNSMGSNIGGNATITPGENVGENVEANIKPEVTEAPVTPENTVTPNQSENVGDSTNTPTITPTISGIPQIPGIDINAIKNQVLTSYMQSAPINQTIETMARAMTEANMKMTVMTKVGELTNTLVGSFASAFNVDESKMASAFQIKMTQDEISRIVTAMMTKKETSARTNLLSFGYQDKEEPTYISFYFKSFDGKEHFMDFLDDYNKKVKAEGEEDKEINYTDTTGILMGSVKTIVNAVTYVLIAFVSISLIVSSIMIGIITYISVYERTKEIGILRAMGASKRNISSIFNAETFIIGLLSGLIGIGVTYSLIPIINSVLHRFTGNIPLNATFYINNAIVLVILSIILTLIGGLIPAKKASKRDPVIALRTE